jgi:hypothetical protein
MKPIICISTLFLLFLSCKSTSYTDAPRPAELYGADNEAPMVSSIAIPINISIADLVASLNSRLPATLYEDNSYDDNNGDDMMMRATKSQDMTLHFSGNTIKYRLPMKLWMRKKLLIGSVDADGELALNMKTTFSIKEDWSLSTKTEVEYHEWLAKPVLRTGLVDLNIETLANLVLNRSKRKLTETLDRTVGQQLTLRPYVQAVWDALQEPTLLSDEYQMWVKTTPLKIGMTPITTDWNNIKAKISVETLNDVTFGAKPTFRANSALPDLTLLNDASDDFQMRIATDVPFSEAERMARAVMIGQEFESGKRKVRVEDIQLWGNNDRMVVNSKLSGAFNGNIYFIGKPVYNAVKNQVEIADLDFHVDTRNFLHRSASWLFQGPIRKKMQDAMTFPLEENITSLRQSVQETLRRYELQPGVVLTGTLDSIAVENTRVLPNSIRVNLFSKGRLQVDVKGL